MPVSLQTHLITSPTKYIGMLAPNSIRLLAVFIASFFFNGSSYAQENITTLQEVLARGQAALAAGDYTTAFKAFETIQTTFSLEPEVSERVFQITIMPLQAMPLC